MLCVTNTVLCLFKVSKSNPEKKIVGKVTHSAKNIFKKTPAGNFFESVKPKKRM